jgi:hypothetical protein
VIALSGPASATFRVEAILDAIWRVRLMLDAKLEDLANTDDV